MFAGFLQPDWSFFFSAEKDGLGYLLLETVCIAFIGTVIGAIVSAPLAFLNTKRFVPAPVSFLFNLVIMVILDLRPYHALLAMGVRPLPAICHSVLPQLKPVFTSIILYRFDVNIREASVLGLVGAGGIGAPLIFSMNQYAWEKAGAIMLGLILLVWFIDMVSEKIGAGN